MIKMQVIGRLGKDCVVNTVNGKNVINFSVAHSEKYKDSQGVLQERTIWAECAYWTDRTAIAQYLTKGTQVYVDGSPDVKAYSRQDNSPGASLTLRVREVQLLGSKNDSTGTPGYSAQQTSAPASNVQAGNEVNEAMVDDLPF